MWYKQHLQEAVKITTVVLGMSVLSGCGVWTCAHTIVKLSDMFPLELDTQNKKESSSHPVQSA